MKLTERDILEALLDKTISINEAKLIMNESLSDVGDWMDDRLGDVAEIGSEVGRAIKRPFINAHNKKVYKHNNAARSAYADKDLQFLQDAKSYKITWNKENIARVLDLQEKAAIEGAKRWNARQGQIQKTATGPINVGPVEVPTPYSGQVKFLGVEGK